MSPIMPRLYLVVLLILLAPVVDAQPLPDDFPRNRLVFSHHADGTRADYDLWTVCPDGTQFASLLVEPGYQIQAAVSPDGSTIAYAAPADSSRDVFTRPFWRGEAVNLTSHPADDTEPAWSHDGSQIAFFSDRDSERPDLYLISLASGEVTRLTENDLHDGGVSWTPDGRALLFTRYFPGEGDASGAGELVRLDLESNSEMVLTALGGYNGSPSVSPDGQKVAFHGSTEEGAELWEVNMDGSTARAITDTFIDEYSPVWSPDGRWIAFTAGTFSDNRGTFDLWIMRADGSDRRLITTAPNTEAWPTWQPGDSYCR